MYVRVGLTYSDHALYDARNVSAGWRPLTLDVLADPYVEGRLLGNVTVFLLDVSYTPARVVSKAYYGHGGGVDGNVTLLLPSNLPGGRRYELLVAWNFTCLDGRRIDFIVNRTCTLTWMPSAKRFSPNVNTTVPGAWRLKCQVYNLTFKVVNSYGNSTVDVKPLGGARVIVVNGSSWNGARWGDGSPPGVMYNLTTPPRGEELAGCFSILIPNTTDVRDPRLNYSFGLWVYWKGVLVYNHTFASNHTRPFKGLPGYVRKVYNVTYLSCVHPRRLEGVWLNCSVYMARFRLVDGLGNPLTPTSSVEVRGVMVNGSLELTPLTYLEPDGTLSLEYASRCVDEAEGNVHAPGLDWRGSIEAELRVEWCCLEVTPASWYRIYNESSTWTGNLSRCLEVWANRTAIRLYDSQQPPQPLSGATVKLWLPGASEALATFSNASGYVDLLGLLGTDIIPAKHAGEDLTYRLTVEWRNVTVYDGSFKISELGRVDGYVEFTARCRVYMVTIRATDSHGRPLEGYSYLKLRAPGGVDLLYTLVDGSVSDRLPGGRYELLGCRYKTEDYAVKALSGSPFTVDSNGVFQLKLSVYDAEFNVTEYFDNGTVVEGLRVYARFPDPWGVQVASFDSEAGLYVLRQLPNTTVAVYMNATPSTEGFEALSDERLVGVDTIKVGCGDVVTSVRSYVYDPVFVVGVNLEGLPEYYEGGITLVVKCNYTSPLVNLTLNVDPLEGVKVNSSQEDRVMLVGGLSYPVRAYVGGLLAYNGSLNLPAPPVEMVAVPTSVVKVTITPYSYSRDFVVPNLRLRVSWASLNSSAVDLDNDTEVRLTVLEHLECFREVKADPARPRHVVLYNLTVDSGEEGTTILVPVWRSDYLNGTVVSVEAWTIPGVTPGVPEGVEEALAVRGVWPRVVYDEAWEAHRGYNLTSDASLRLVVYASSLTCRALDRKGVALEGYKVSVELGGVTLASSVVGPSGEVVFKSTRDLCFWCNYTYTCKCTPPDPYGVLRHPLTKVVRTPRHWGPGYLVDLSYTGFIATSLKDSMSRPVPGMLVCAVNNTGPGVGEVTIYVMSDVDGRADIPLPWPGGVYDVKVFWMNGSQPYFDLMLGYVNDVEEGRYLTVHLELYDVRLWFVSDVGRPLAGLKVKVVSVQPRGAYSLESSAGPSGLLFLRAVPRATYSVKAYWPGSDIKVYEGAVIVTDNVERRLKCMVYDVMLRLTTRRGTPLSSAKVSLKLPDGLTVSAMADKKGAISLVNVPVGEVKVVDAEWMGYSLELKPSAFSVSASRVYELTAVNVASLKVRVVGALGQGLGPATVIVRSATFESKFTTDPSGVALIDLPHGVYNVTAIAYGRSTSTTAYVLGDTEVTLRLEVYAVILGQPLGLYELLALMALIVALAVVVAVIVHEYAAKREKMLFRV